METLAFFSSKLSALTKQGTVFSSFDCKLKGLYLAIRHFKFYFRRERLHIIYRPEAICKSDGHLVRPVDRTTSNSTSTGLYT